MATIKFNINKEIVEMDSEEVSKAIETGEVKIESDKLIVKSEDNVIFTKSELEGRDKTLKDDEYKSGKTAGEEMAFKAMKNESGYEIEGYKDAKTFVTAFKAKVIEDAKIAPDKKIQDLTTDNDKLRTNYDTLEGEFNTYKNGVKERESRTKKDTELFTYLPTEGLKVNQKLTLMALKSEAGIDLAYGEDGKSFLTMNGEMIKNEKALPVAPKEYIESKLTSLDLITKNGGGGGGGDDTGDGKAGSYEAFEKEMKAKGDEYAPGTQNFAIEMNKRIKDKTLVM